MSVDTALFYALLLACPVMMVGMVAMMMRALAPDGLVGTSLPAEVTPHEAGRGLVPSARSDSTD